MTDTPGPGSANRNPGSTGASGQGHSGADRSAEATLDSLRDQASSVVQAAQTQAAGVIDQARESVVGLAEQQKSAASAQIDQVARAAHDAARRLEQDLPPAAHLVHQAASGIDRLSAELRDRSVEDIVRDVGQVVRSQPLAFFGGCVLFGFVAARFLKSASPGGVGNGGHRPGSVPGPQRPRAVVRVPAATGTAQGGAGPRPGPGRLPG